MLDVQSTKQLMSSISNQECVVTRDFEDLTTENLLQKAHDILELVDQSPIFREKIFRPFPSFELNEIEKGDVLGEGAFGVVTEVRKINCNTASAVQKEDNGEAHSTSRVEETEEAGKTLESNKSTCNDECCTETEKIRDFMSQRCLRHGEARYAVKSLMKSKLTDSDWARGRIDLSIEVKFLQALNHPNIIRMRGVFRSKNPVHPLFFFVMDRLYGTLQERIAEWSHEKRGALRRLFRKPDRDFLWALYIERLFVSCDIASALYYMHQNKVIHR
mmetsp:Transcript_18814/g.28584  ORF Transcript_18814/g.28584 Transcript_18814/m.28584 type:complete len:274 (-) Transcript_18814:74-895(-)